MFKRKYQINKLVPFKFKFLLVLWSNHHPFADLLMLLAQRLLSLSLHFQFLISLHETQAKKYELLTHYFTTEHQLVLPLALELNSCEILVVKHPLPQHLRSS